MSIYFVHVGGGPIGAKDYTREPWQRSFPSAVPSCCATGMPDAAQPYDPKYPAHFTPSRHHALACYLADKTIAAGDKFVLSMLHAGIDAHTLAVYAKAGCTGLKYHYELHDLYALVGEANGGAASVAEIAFPSIAGDAAVEVKYDVRAANGGAPYYGSRAGKVTVDGEDVCCSKHKVLVLVVEALPAADATPTNGCNVVPCNYTGAAACGSSLLDCFHVDAFLHVYVPMGLHAT